ncbi:hypothetical protein GYMLUDRAFT_49025 [Collybiopsis luxurians FD-317 M1]|uniref:Amidase domain-containing protein n=1 Tax=Collybiopsis luxurians FD-317 M1 TaxID=944289 RepID=A0A0D0AU87_9AGAR|nr:hypothetical protein GYMLUDRAFT_49025 [Collybiopsis luxurians FD-317 M1]
MNSLTSPPKLPDLYEATISELQEGLDKNLFSSVDLVKAYFARIEEVNLNGPALRAVLETNPTALRQAADRDSERRTKGKRGPLHGIPILLKDNIATDGADGMETTAGSYALKGSIVPDGIDAWVVQKLYNAGAIILGKANLSEWGQFRSHKLTGGWSPLGGQGTNAYYPNGDPAGSSSGSAVATSIGLTAASLGSDTSGSITYPASRNNIVGIKPTVGLTSRTGVIPICSHQDTVGPLARTVADVAILLSAIAGPDPDDEITLSQPAELPDYTNALDVNALAGKRIGVPRKVFFDDQTHPVIVTAFEEAVQTMKEMGAIIVDPADLPAAEELIENGWEDEELICQVDFKIDMNRYLSSLAESPTGVRSVEDIIKFIKEHPELEQPKGYEDYSVLVQSNSTTGYDANISEILERKTRLSREGGIDGVLEKYNLDALVAPDSRFQAAASANAGYPMIQVPLGFFPDDIEPLALNGGPTFYPAPGMPFGVAFIGSAWSEYKLIGMAYAYEQMTRTRMGRRAYPEAVPHSQL